MVCDSVSVLFFFDQQIPGGRQLKRKGAKGIQEEAEQ